MTNAKRIMICNERFLFRFGADRALIILGKGMKDQGHTVYLAGNHFDREIARSFASNIIEVPIEGEYINLDEFTFDWLKLNWDKYFDSSTKPDIVVIGGWPFLSAIPFFRERGCIVVYSDYGTVPLKGYSGPQLEVLKQLRRLRKKYMSQSTAVIGISRFIIESQSYMDAGKKSKVYCVLLGADHMELNIWSAINLHLENRGFATNILTSSKNQNRKTILLLGRWEPNCYKNSEAIIDIVRRINKVIPDCTSLILADPSNTNIPLDLQNSIIPIGSPDDKELADIMKNVNLGISTSLWEGFNLPIAEMQWLGKPVLAFNVGAHPEVILHPWYLCKNNKEMAVKACAILSRQDLDENTKKEALGKFRNYFKWSRVIEDYSEIFEKLTGEKGKTVNSRQMLLLVDVTNAARDPANNGPIRVSRRLSRELQDHLDPIFVIWSQDHNCYVLLTREEYEILGQFNGPLLTHPDRVSPKDSRIMLDEYLGSRTKDFCAWLLFPEIVNEAHGCIARKYARERNIQLAAIFYDAIPILYPELCKETTVRNNHKGYMIGLAECDVIIPISNYSGKCLEEFWREINIKGCPILINPLPGEFSGFDRSNVMPKLPLKNINMLCVSTLEPRKNHKTLIQACIMLQEKYPHLDWSLTLVGNRCVGSFDIADYVQDISKKYPRIKWLGIVDDKKLHRLYSEATFTVYPSITEGFGMPILESIWHGKPCICSDEGVMAELATEGGCLTTRITDAQMLFESIYRLAMDSELLLGLSKQAIARRMRMWDDYVCEFISVLETVNKNRIVHIREMENKSASEDFAIIEQDWQDVFYPNYLCDNWQMNHSERLCLIALLSRLRPNCSIEIGTYKGGSLSVISEYSKIIFSIDIDPSIPERLKQFNNVRFLTGPSEIILPLLLKELTAAGISVDFVLIDAEHTGEGVKKDLGCLLSYIPKKPMFVLIHDSFNPECRRGLLAVDWDKSPYTNYVDLDFIPGTIIEHSGRGQGELWGGFTLAYFSPEPRKRNLKVNASAETMFKKLAGLT